MGHPLFNLKNRTAVVIGGTSGIGLTLAKGLAEAGANVIATGRRSELVQKITSEIRDIGVRSLALPCDVTNAADVENLLAAAGKEMGGVEILTVQGIRSERQHWSSRMRNGTRFWIQISRGLFALAASLGVIC